MENGQKLQQEVSTDIINQQILSDDNTELIQQFKRQIKALRYPVVLKKTNISMRSLQQFFYEYVPNKQISLKVSNYSKIRDIDIIIMPQIVNQQSQPAPLQQELTCKQIIEIYDLVNIGNTHTFVKDPYTLNNYIFSNGHLIASVVYISQGFILNLTNNFQIQLLNAIYNLYLIQDILLFDQRVLFQTIESIESVQINKLSGYMGVKKLSINEYKRISQILAGKQEMFSLSKYSLDGIFVIFTQMTKSQLLEYVHENREFTDIYIMDLTEQMWQSKQQIYIAKVDNFLFTNIFAYITTIQLPGPEEFYYQFDLNSIYFLMMMQIQYKYLFHIDFLQFDLNQYINMLANIEYPKDDNFKLQHKLSVSPILTGFKQLRTNK